MDRLQQNYAKLLRETTSCFHRYLYERINWNTPFSMKRFDNIDILRGVVMIIMCIDHARDYTGIFPADPMLLEQTPLWLYLLRILAHFCAPTFILLSGISLGISGERTSKQALSHYLLTRGAVLVFLELTLVNWGWSFNPLYGVVYLQIIWAIGISMMIMAAAIHLRRKAILALSLLILFGHNLFGEVSFGEGTPQHYLWSFFMQKNMLPVFEGLTVRTTYPVLPVLAVMMFGYCLSNFYTRLDSLARRKKLLLLGGGMFVLFLILRLVVGYGDSAQVEWEHWGKSTFNLTKYPLSLNFVLCYLSLPLLYLSLSDMHQYSHSNIFISLGRCPMFFYIFHLYLLHIIILLYLLYDGYVLDFTASLGGVPAEVGFPAWWLLWVIPLVVGLLILPCRAYYKLRKSGRYKWMRYI